MSCVEIEVDMIGAEGIRKGKGTKCKDVGRLQR